MILSRYTINNINSENLLLPDAAQFELPEKVLQFGAGALLRGGPDYWIDKANRQGIFNGRIVVVEGAAADAAVFEKQDCLYTVRLSGANSGEGVTEQSINTAISRVIPAKDDWQQVLECAHNPEMRMILSHTSEESLQLIYDDVRLHPPKSFPGKQLAFLFERFKAFGGSPQSGLVVVPTENVPDNGKKLEALVFELAHLNGLHDAFIEWLETCNQFCNSTIAGFAAQKPGSENHLLLKEQLGYTDPLLVVTDENGTWIIEGDESVKKIVSFAQAGEHVSITPGKGQQNTTILQTSETNSLNV